MLDLARETGYELSDEELEAVSGGSWDGEPSGTPATCPQCGSTHVDTSMEGAQSMFESHRCRDCGYEWSTS